MEQLQIYLNGSEQTSQMPNDSRNILHPLLNLDYFVLSVLISILSIIGILGNIPVLIVYIKRKDRIASTTFIKFLAFLDLLVCSLVMPYSMVYEFHLVTSDVMCRSFEVLRHFTVMASNVTLVAIAVERYVAVCQIGTKISVKNIKRGVWAIVVISLFFASPAFGTFAVVNETEVEDVQCNFPHETTSGHFCHFTFTIMGKNLVLVYQIVQAAMFCLVLLVIVVLYTIIYVVLWKKTKKRRELTQRHMPAVNHFHTTFNESLLTELADKCNGRKQKILAPEDKMLPAQTVSLNYVNEDADINDDIDDDLSSSTENETGCKPDIKVKFNNDLDGDRKTTYNGVTVTSDCNGENVKSYTTEMKKSTNTEEKVDKKKKKRYCHRRTAKMLFMCTVIYFVTWLPFWLDIFGITNSLSLRYLFFIGNASNPIVYGIINEQVRNAIKKLFFSQCSKCCSFAKYAEETDNTLNCSSSLSQ